MRTDIIFGQVNGDYDLLINNGDFVMAQSDIQHVRHIIEAEQGNYKQVPLVGVGVRKMINGTLDGSTKRVIRLQLKSDGYQASEIQVGEQGIVVKL
jgi:hypothetical protein